MPRARVAGVREPFTGPVLSARSRGGRLPGVELTETGESGPSAVELQLWEVERKIRVTLEFDAVIPTAAIIDLYVPNLSFRWT